MPADIRATLPSGSRERIREDAQALGEHLMLPAGGFVLSDYGDDRAIGVEPDAKLTLYRAFNEVPERFCGRPPPDLQVQEQRA